jgi:hypothetical protein
VKPYDWRVDLAERRDNLAQAFYAVRWGLHPASLDAWEMWNDAEREVRQNYLTDARDYLLGDLRVVMLNPEILDGLVAVGIIEKW